MTGLESTAMKSQSRCWRKPLLQLLLPSQLSQSGSWWSDIGMQSEVTNIYVSPNLLSRKNSRRKLLSSHFCLQILYECISLVKFNSHLIPSYRGIYKICFYLLPAPVIRKVLWREHQMTRLYPGNKVHLKAMSLGIRNYWW